MKEWEWKVFEDPTTSETKVPTCTEPDAVDAETRSAEFVVTLTISAITILTFGLLLNRQVPDPSKS